MASVADKNGIALADAGDGDERPLPTTVEQKHGFLTIYKHGQGYWTRIGTGAGALLLIIVTAMFVYEQVGTFYTKSRTVPAVATGAVVLGFALLAWRIMNKPRNAEFLIATDVEMKKVNWGSRQEVLGSTRIVIIFLFLLAAILYVIDVLTGITFELMGVLKAGFFGK